MNVFSDDRMSETSIGYQDPNCVYQTAQKSRSMERVQRDREIDKLQGAVIKSSLAEGEPQFPKKAINHAEFNLSYWYESIQTSAGPTQ